MDNHNDEQNKPVGGRVVAGASLSLLGTLGARVLGIVAVAVLGRVLSPHDFGVMALAMIFVGLSEAVMSRQFDLACIRTRNITDHHYNTAFTLSVLWGAIAAGLIFALATPIATLMQEPEVGPMLHFLALVPLLDGLRNPYFVRFERSLNFLPEVAMTFFSKTAQITTAIALALIWRDYWAMAVGLVVFTTMRMLATYGLARRMPGLSLRHAGAFLRFGGWLSGTGLVGFIMQRSDTVLISARLGTSTLGLYNLGYEITQMVTNYLAQPLMRIVYPGLAEVSGSRTRLCAAYYKAQATLMGILLPIGVGAALTAPEVIVLFIGHKWLAAAPVLQILLPVTALSCLVYIIQAVLMVDGNTRAMFMRNLTVAVVQIPLVWTGLVLGGFVGGVAARAGAILFHTGLSLSIAARSTGDPWYQTLIAIWRSFVSVGVMVVGVSLVSWITTPATTEWQALWLLALKAGVGGTLYVGTHTVLWLASARPEGVETLVIRLLQAILRRLGLPTFARSIKEDTP